MCMAVTMVDSLRHSVWAVWFCLTCSHGVSELALTAGCSLAVKTWHRVVPGGGIDPGWYDCPDG